MTPAWRKRPNRKRKKTMYKKKRSVTRFKKSSLPFPRIFKSNFKMVDQFTLNPPSASPYLDTAIYRATSFYQPLIGSTHQPRYFDQVMPMYDHYVVLGTKVTVEAINADVGNPVILAIGLFDDGAPLSGINDYLENKHSRWKTLATRDTGKSTYLSCKYSPKFLGKNNVINDDEMKGSIGSNPSENAYIHIAVAPMDGFSDAGNVRLIVTTQMYVAFIEPKDVSASTV